MRFGPKTILPGEKPYFEIKDGKCEPTTNCPDDLKRAFTNDTNTHTLQREDENKFKPSPRTSLPSPVAQYAESALKRRGLECKQLKAKTTGLTQQITSAMKETEKTKTSLQTAEQELDRLKKAKAALKDVARFNRVFDQNIIGHAKVQQEKINAARAIRLDSTNSTLKKMRDDLQAYVDDLHTKVNAKTQNAKDINAAKDVLTNQCDNEIDCLDEAISAQEKAIKKCKADYRDCCIKLGDLELVQKETKSNLADVEGRIKKAQVQQAIATIVAQNNPDKKGIWCKYEYAGPAVGKKSPPPAKLMIKNDALTGDSKEHFNEVAKFYVALAQKLKQDDALPLDIYKGSMFGDTPLLRIQANGTIDYFTACPKDLMTAINNNTLQQQATAAKTTAAQPPTSAPPPPNTAAISAKDSDNNVINVQAARNTAATFAATYNTQNTAAKLVVGEYDSSKPTSFTVSASTQDALNCGLIELLKAASTKNSTAIFVAKNNEGCIIYSCTGGVVSVPDQNGTLMPLTTTPSTSSATAAASAPPNLNILPSSELHTQTPSTLLDTTAASHSSQTAPAPQSPQRENPLQDLPPKSTFYISSQTNTEFTDEEKKKIDELTGKFKSDYPEIQITYEKDNKSIRIQHQDPAILKKVADGFGLGLATDNPDKKYNAYNGNTFVYTYQKPITQEEIHRQQQVSMATTQTFKEQASALHKPEAAAPTTANKNDEQLSPKKYY